MDEGFKARAQMLVSHDCDANERVQEEDDLEQHAEHGVRVDHVQAQILGVLACHHAVWKRHGQAGEEGQA